MKVTPGLVIFLISALFTAIIYMAVVDIKHSIQLGSAASGTYIEYTEQLGIVTEVDDCRISKYNTTCTIKTTKGSFRTGFHSWPGYYIGIGTPVSTKIRTLGTLQGYYHCQNDKCRHAHNCADESCFNAEYARGN